MSWHTSRLAAFDTETSGVDVEQDRIVTAAVLLVGGGRATETHTWLANPGVEIPESASAVHGITTERARMEGRPAAEVVTLVSALLAEQVAAGAPIVAMNARFDVTLLDRELGRHGLPSLAEQAGREPLVIDPYVIDKAVDKWRKGPRKLLNLAHHYGVRLTADDAHNAGADALAAARIAYRQAVVYPELQEGGAELLHLRQATWAREQAIDLQAYLREKNNDPNLVIDGAWPLIPRQEVAS
ncbi:exonuclease domain-containing protein [Kitasatospora sp. NPDC101235]|uniref:exonuclease domain-containing protein n=1 Tax=Kitasatospora sp. NPDC101235 TaxID=3364101 RepID=UPI003813237B